ncbi:MAG: rod shape-determining protein RodA [Sphingobacteriaceae bacterium]|nr:rod shape-determining protein RodA [Sphingobacteriaceae bacterium]
MSNNQPKNFFYNVDWITVLLFIALSAIGFFSIYATVYNPEKMDGFSFTSSYGKQLIYILSGLIIGFFILLVDMRFFNALAPIIYGVTVVLLIAVLVVGRNVGGNQAWISLGGDFKLQPSEFAKFSTALLLSRYVGLLNPTFSDVKSILIAALIVGFPMFLIMRQPDAGSTLVFLSFMFPLYREGLSGYFLLVFLGMITLFVADFLIPIYVLIFIIIGIGGLFIYLNKRKRNTIILVALACICYLFFVKFAFNHILKTHQKTRIELILGLKQDSRGSGYNVIQSKIAIGSGKFTGRGFLQGTQTKYGYVPAQSTDFIFSTVGEEWGFMGSFVVLGLFLFLLLRIINMAERQKSVASRVYGYCVASILFFHVFINIGMTIGVVPVIGIPLPFISYGGSSFWGFTVLLFTFIKFDSNRMGLAK